MIKRGGLYWADHHDVASSRPAERRPVLVISADSHNHGRLATVVAAVITSSTCVATLPGTVFLPAAVSGLPRDSVVHVTAVLTLNTADRGECPGDALLALLREVVRGLRASLGLEHDPRTGAH